MTDLVRLYAQIALLRRGPQDVPASTALLAVTIAAYILVNILTDLILPADSGGPWLQLLALDVLFTVVWYAALLRVVKKPERFVQTTAAVFGYKTVLSPLIAMATWLLTRFENDTVWQFPVGLVYLIVLVWVVAVNSHVLKEALEWSTPSCVALVILQLVTLMLLASMFPTAR